jgi:hypothetical protein
VDINNEAFLCTALNQFMCMYIFIDKFIDRQEETKNIFEENSIRIGSVEINM